MSEPHRSKEPSGDYDRIDWGNRFPQDRQWRDLIWYMSYSCSSMFVALKPYHVAVLFYIHLVAVLLVGFMYFSEYKSEIMKDDPTDKKAIHMNTAFWVALATILTTSLLIAIFWLYIIREYPTKIIKICFVLVLILDLIVAGYLIATGHLLAGFLLLLIPLLMSLILCCWPEAAAKFAAICLETVVNFIDFFPATVYIALGFVLLQVVWIVLWILCAVGMVFAAKKGSDKGDDTGMLLFFLLAISFFWTSQVLKNVVHVTTAGTFATWYFNAADQIPSNPTLGAAKRALTTSFGSICLGSLIIAIVKAIRVMIQYATRNENDCVRCIAMCIIDCIDAIVRYFNMYAFTQIAIYGMTYCEAAVATWNLLMHRGFDMIINDDLIGLVLFIGALFGGLCAGCAGALVGLMMNQPTNTIIIFGVLGFLVGLALTICVMEVLESSVSALFVCFAQDPAALFATHPDLYEKLSGAFRDLYDMRPEDWQR